MPEAPAPGTSDQTRRPSLALRACWGPTMRYFSLAILVTLSVSASTFAADAFDRHTSKWLAKGIAKQQPRKSLSLEQAGELKTIDAGIGSPCIVVKTNDGNLTKALLAWGYRRGKGNKLIPVLLIERYVTYRANRGDTAAAAGKDVMLFAGFTFNFDIGQVVPAGQGGDIRLTDKATIEPVGKAELFGLNGPQLPKSEKGDKPTAGNRVASRDYAGTWKVTVDGRWSGEMQLSLEHNSKLRGKYTSKESKSTYDVTGRIAQLRHHVKLAIQLDNATQSIDAFLFTHDKSTMAGYATLAGRKFGFLATRVKRGK